MSSLQPPFKRIGSVVLPWPAAATSVAEAPSPEPDPGRLRLRDLDVHFLCSVIGTCLTTGELRKVMARSIDVAGLDDLAVHHEAVALASDGGAVCRAVQKALDRRHAPALAAFAAARDADALGRSWSDALRSGEIPGAYWAVLTHRRATDALRKRVFGDVHMLSHLVGAANRADIRRLVALEAENAELRESAERERLRHRGALAERDVAVDAARRALAAAQAEVSSLRPSGSTATVAESRGDADRDAAARQRAEREFAAMAQALERTTDALARSAEHARSLEAELAVAEAELAPDEARDATRADVAPERLRGRRVLYVGGRPGSSRTIRDLVVRHGGEFRRHDGGLEDRKGLLASQVAWSDVVAFPVDCIDHDSATNLKRLCAHTGADCLALRSAGVSSFLAAFAEPEPAEDGSDARPSSEGSGWICRRHF